MAMIAGTKPADYSSVLTDLSKELYDERIANDIYKPETAISTTVGGVVYTEEESYRRLRVFKGKMASWVDANTLIEYMKDESEIYDVVIRAGETEVYTSVTPTFTGSGNNTGGLKTPLITVTGSVADAVATIPLPEIGISGTVKAGENSTLSQGTTTGKIK